MVTPTLHLNKISKNIKEKILSNSTSSQINMILREVVTNKNGTASLADVFGFDVGGKLEQLKNLFMVNTPKKNLILLYPFSL